VELKYNDNDDDGIRMDHNMRRQGVPPSGLLFLNSMEAGTAYIS
jgi:hypothetical protein